MKRTLEPGEEGDEETVLDVLCELDPDDLPPTWGLARFEQYLGSVLERV